MRAATPVVEYDFQTSPVRSGSTFVVKSSHFPASSPYLGTIVVCLLRTEKHLVADVNNAMSSVDKTGSWAIDAGLTSAGVFVGHIFSDPVRFQHRPAIHSLCQSKCACDNVWSYVRTYNKLLGPQVHCMVRLRVISLISNSTGSSGPGPDNMISPRCKPLCWLFQRAKAVGTHPSAPRVRAHHREGCVLWFLLPVQ